MKIQIIIIISVLASTISAFSQTKIKTEKFVGMSYWTKFVLATEGNCKIEITPTDISPSEEICVFSAHLKTDTKIKLLELSDEKNWAKLKFQTADKREFDVYLKNDSRKTFHKSFKLAFSKNKRFKEDYYPYDNSLDTKLDLIKNLGFPTSISRDKENEKWTFGADWVYFDFYNYDETYIYLENDKVTKINGII